MAKPHTTSLFPTIGSLANQTDKSTTKPEDGDQVVQEIASLCMKCHEQGTTRLMLTSIPYFREVIVMSFRCEFCGATNNEIQSAGEIKAEGTLYTAKILVRPDLDRQIVRSPTCEILIPEYQLTLPATTRGQLTTVEGLVRDIVTDLSTDQPLRRIQDEEGYTKVQDLIDKLKEILGDEEDEDAEVQVGNATKKEYIAMPAFTLKLDDPAGNSWIEFNGTMADPKWNMRTYPRTLQQNIALGLVSGEEERSTASAPEVDKVDVPVVNGAITDDEVFVFPGRCSSCGHPLDTLMKKVNIPYFKDILIMSTNCDRCGYRDNEVKSGSAISDQGKRITLKVEDRDDLSRDILKSETAGLTIPEIDLVLQHGTLGGRFTTLEGILNQVYEELSEKVFASGDASTSGEKTSFEKFLGDLKGITNAERSFTVILDDPLANSYMQNIYAPDPDPNMTIEFYDRTFDQNEYLGLNDIKVEGYEGDAPEKVLVPELGRG
ncbi:zinc-finger protein zpr1 [Collybia nuda]|uniref:Zinc-finger protein zpr1 n=1 Tax=Collybia nuda TaxID=64659 RepID=A0A9P6CLU5_9AGAR|nr:zinc-finger protein zpr1 [Collybia nuda]